MVAAPSSGLRNENTEQHLRFEAKSYHGRESIEFIVIPEILAKN